MRSILLAILTAWTLAGIVFGILVVLDQQKILNAYLLTRAVNRVTDDPFEGMFILMNLLILWLGGVIFLSTLTLSTHHPFAVPAGSPEVLALQAEPDGYVAALRYVDLEFERFFSDLQRRGLLKNTVVFVLGDHGRHEPIGRNEQEKQVGHFLSPLFIWVDGSLRNASNFKPRTVGTIASQVDLMPTILGMNGLLPRVSPFLGRDMSCALSVECQEDNTAFLSSAYDDMIGFADHEGILSYSFRTETVSQADLNLEGPPVRRLPADPDVAARYRRMLGLYVSANSLLEQGRVWSWKELGGAL